MRKIAVLLAVLATTSARAAAPAQGVEPAEMRRGWDFSELGHVPTQTGGRIKPLDSFAREVTLFSTGSRKFQGWKQIELLLSWIAFPAEWEGREVLTVAVKDTRRQIGIDEERTRFSPGELIRDSYLAQYAERMGRPGQQVTNLSGGIVRQDPREQEMRRVLERIAAFRNVTSGEAWLVSPQPAPAQWKPLSEPGPQGKALQGVFKEMVDAYRAKDEARFMERSQALRTAVESAVPGWNGGLRRMIAAEHVYSGWHPFMWGWIMYLLASLGWTVSIAVKRGGKTERHWKTGAAALTWAGTAALIGGIAIRCYIAGRPPVTNMYESIIWVSFGVMLFAGILYWKHRQSVILAVATALSCFGLIAADAAPAMMDPGIHPLVPVLRSNYWLTIHVLTITLGYAAFALTLGLGNVTLWQFIKKGKGSSARITDLNQLTYRAMQFGVVLLAAGTILGGIWADYSWGRFWGWDPKEVWALIALLGYVAILHARYAGWMGPLGYAAWTVISFMLVVMAWYGVNFVLGVGLHSYGFSTGGRGTVALFCVAQLSYVAGIWGYARMRRVSPAR